jgi:hypothetical protein
VKSRLNGISNTIKNGGWHEEMVKACLEMVVDGMVGGMVDGMVDGIKPMS